MEATSATTATPVPPEDKPATTAAVDPAPATSSTEAKGGGGTYDPNNPFLYTDEAGHKWQWDATKQTWLPFVVEEAVLEQQVYVPDDMPAAMFPPLGELDSSVPEGAKKAGGKKRKGKPAAPKAPPKTTAVYVSGLPLDITKEELVAFMGKCGIIKKDAESGEYKVKLYEDEQGRPKGDALVVYFKRESVDLALQLLDESAIRSGSIVRVSEAKFEHHQQLEKPKEKIVGKKKKKKPRINQEDELSWVEWETRRHVIIKHMFTPEEAYGDEDFYVDLKNEIREEVEKFGDVEVLTVFERNPEGVVAVKFAEPEAAVKCIEVMNGRYFAKRRLEAEWYDGITNYKVKENDEDEKRRLDAFGDWLENQSSSDEEDEGDE